MSRKHIFELIKTKQPTPTEAFARIRYRYDHSEYRIRLETDPYDNTMSSYTVARFIETFIFPLFPIQTTHISLSDFIRDLGIQIDGPQTLGSLLSFIEFIWYAIDATPPEVLDCTITQYGGTHIYSDIESIINLTLAQIGYKEARVSEGRIVVKQDYKTEQAVKLMTDLECADLLFQYNHFSNNGDLRSKQAILEQLGVYFEPILNERSKHKDSHWHSTAEILSDLLNNFQIRHNNKEGSNRKEFIAEMDDTEIEKWYDKTHSVIVQLIIEQENENVSKEIKQLRKSVV